MKLIVKTIWEKEIKQITQDKQTHKEKNTEE
jgi:hypothetical protein